jgi:hypothetical protein
LDAKDSAARLFPRQLDAHPLVREHFGEQLQSYTQNLGQIFLGKAIFLEQMLQQFQ